MESNFTDLKTRTMEITKEQIKELKTLLWILDSKHNVSVPQTQENINYIADEIVKLFSIPVVVKQSELLFCKCGLQKGGTFTCMRTDCDSIDLNTK